MGRHCDNPSDSAERLRTTGQVLAYLKAHEAGNRQSVRDHSDAILHSCSDFLKKSSPSEVREWRVVMISDSKLRVRFTNMSDPIVALIGYGYNGRL